MERLGHVSAVYSLVYMNVACVAGSFLICPHKILSLHVRLFYYVGVISKASVDIYLKYFSGTFT